MFQDIHALNSSAISNKNIITEIEARTKVIFVIICLIINLISPTPVTPLLIILMTLTTLLMVRVPLKKLALRLILPSVMAVVIFITQIFFYGHTPLFTFFLGNLKITGYIEGLYHGVLIICRVIAGVMLVLFLSMTTPAHKLIMAAYWFRIPKVLTELLMLIYRYTFVLLEEMVSIHEAQKVRLGYVNWRKKMHSLSILAGSLIIRAYDRANRVFDAMVVRGYRGAMSIVYIEHFRKRDLWVAIAMAGIISVLSLTLLMMDL